MTHRSIRRYKSAAVAVGLLLGVGSAGQAGHPGGGGGGGHHAGGGFGIGSHQGAVFGGAGFGPGGFGRGGGGGFAGGYGGSYGGGYGFGGYAAVGGGYFGFGYGGLGGSYLPSYVPVPVPIPVPVPVGASQPGGLMLPRPAGVPARADQANNRARTDPAKSESYLTIGDNLFRAGNVHRAEQRYLQAAKANPTVAAPLVRLAQVALTRGDYREAAEQLRTASTVEPGWLINAADVQALFGEPADFAKVLAKLETHLQATPGDRDGWLVLGAEWYLSGRARQAADVFTRLNDRKPDATLAAFLDATTPDALPRDAR